MLKTTHQPTCYENENAVNAVPLSGDYTVTVNGQSCAVRACTVSAMPFNRPWPGKQRSVDQTEQAAYMSFSADEAVTLEVKCTRPFQSAAIRPLMWEIPIRREGDTLSFTLAQPGQYVLEPDDQHFALHIFFNPIKDCPEREQATYYFGPGIHVPVQLRLQDNDVVYLDDDAVVYASVIGENVKNVRILGNGVLDGTVEERLFNYPYGDHSYNNGNIRFINSENIVIDGPILLNSAVWALSTFDCENVTIDNVKIVGQWRYNADGIDLCNTSHAVVKNSFIRSFDDTVVIKGLYRRDMAIEDILVDNCVMWCDWGNNAEIGFETAVREIRDIHYRDCKLIHSSVNALNINNGNRAEIHHITYENIWLECSEEMAMVLQRSDDAVYAPERKTQIPNMIRCGNSKYLKRFENDFQECPVYGRVHDILYKNIRITTAAPRIRPPLVFTAHPEGEQFRNISIEGLYLNGGEQKDFSQFELRVEHSDPPSITG